MDAAAKVDLNFLTPATVRSVVVEVSGPGISPPVLLNLPVGTDSTARGTLALTAGGGRRFVITAFDTAGVATHRADTTLTLQSGSNPPLAVRVVPLASSLGITVAFGGARVTVADTTRRLMLVGDTAIVLAEARSAAGALLSKDSLTWGSSNPAIVAVTGGVLRSRREGSATITVGFRGATARVAVLVTETAFPAESLTVVPAGNVTRWSPDSGGNGHSYELVAGPTSWTDAHYRARRRAVTGVRGHLVTITSAAENTFVRALLVRALGGTVNFGVYAGGYQDRSGADYVEPAGGWRWVTGEPWSFTAWNGGEPNNSGLEDWLMVWGHPFWGTWNDIKDVPAPVEAIRMLVEYPLAP